MTEARPSPLAGTTSLFAEAPVWLESEQSLFWIDCMRPALHRYHLRSGRSDVLDVTLPELITGMVPLRGDGLLLVASAGLFSIDVGRRTCTKTPIRPAISFAGANDGKADPFGRLWVGIGAQEATNSQGHLLRIDPQGIVTIVDFGFDIPNGPALTEDGRLLYLADTARNVIYAYDVEPAEGLLMNRRIFAVVPKELGQPDGMTLDRAGDLWVAGYGAGCVSRLTSSGSIDTSVRLPAPRTTSCAFGGDQFTTLYVTAANMEWLSPGPELEAARAIDWGKSAPAVFALKSAGVGSSPCVYG